MAVLYFPVFAGLCLALLASRGQPDTARALYRLLLAASLAPYLLHVWYTWGYVTRSSFDGPEGGTPVFPGLVAFALTGVGGAALVLAACVPLLRRAPLLCALAPAATWLLYWYVALRLLYWRGPVHLQVDNVPLVWLFASSAFSTALLLLFGWLALVRPAGGRAPSG